MRHRKSGVIAVAYNPLKAVGIIGVAGRNRSPKTDYPRCDTPLPSEPVPQVTDHVGDGQVAQGYHLRERADQTALLAVERATDQLAGIRNRSGCRTNALLGSGREPVIRLLRLPAQFGGRFAPLLVGLADACVDLSDLLRFERLDALADLRQTRIETAQTGLGDGRIDYHHDERQSRDGVKQPYRPGPDDVGHPRLDHQFDARRPAPNARNPLRYTRPLMLNGLPE